MKATFLYNLTWMLLCVNGGVIKKGWQNNPTADEPTREEILSLKEKVSDILTGTYTLMDQTTKLIHENKTIHTELMNSSRAIILLKNETRALRVEIQTMKKKYAKLEKTFEKESNRMLHNVTAFLEGMSWNILRFLKQGEEKKKQSISNLTMEIRKQNKEIKELKLKYKKQQNMNEMLGNKTNTLTQKFREFARITTINLTNITKDLNNMDNGFNKTFKDLHMFANHVVQAYRQMTRNLNKLKKVVDHKQNKTTVTNTPAVKSTQTTTPTYRSFFDFNQIW